jgi:ribosomal protein S21
MNIKSKQFNAIVQGRTNSVDTKGDFSFAIRKWKKNLKENKTIETVFENKFFQKKSDKKRKQREVACYNQLKENQND